MNRKLIKYLISAIFCLGVGIQTTYASDVIINKDNFPDAVLRYYVENSYDINKDGKLQSDEIKNIKKIKVDKAYEQEYYFQFGEGPEYFDTFDCKGLEYFIYLEKLYISVGAYTDHNGFTDTSKLLNLKNIYGLKELKVLSIKNADNIKAINFNKINNLETVKLYDMDKLTNLYFGNENDLKNITLGNNNNLKKVNFSKLNNLSKVIFDTTNFKNITFGRKNKTVKSIVIKHQDGTNKSIKKLDLSKLANLKSISIDAKNLKELDLSRNKKLKYITLKNNKKMKKIDLSKNKKVKKIWCYNNKLKKIKVYNQKKINEITVDKKVKVVDVK